MRTQSTQLPTKEELLSMLSREEDRVIPNGKTTIHYPDFSTLLRLLERCNIDTNFWNEEITLETLTNDHIAYVDTLLEKLVAYILQNQKGLKLYLDALYEYLAEEDAPQKGDLIFVFGSDKPYRINTAIELYTKGYAPHIMISGSNPSYKETPEEPEALRHKHYAVSKGIPEDAIITEIHSISVPGNVKHSLNMLDSLHHQYSHILLVNSPFATRRGWCHFKKFTPDSVTFSRINSFASPAFAKEGWYTNETGIRSIIKEFFSMKMGIITNTA